MIRLLKYDYPNFSRVVSQLHMEGQPTATEPQNLVLNPPWLNIWIEKQA